jgi:hypothetical protein
MSTAMRFILSSFALAPWIVARGRSQAGAIVHSLSLPWGGRRFCRSGTRRDDFTTHCTKQQTACPLRDAMVGIRTEPPFGFPSAGFVGVNVRQQVASRNAGATEDDRRLAAGRSRHPERAAAAAAVGREWNSGRPKRAETSSAPSPAGQGWGLVGGQLVWPRSSRPSFSWRSASTLVSWKEVRRSRSDPCPMSERSERAGEGPRAS